MFELPEAPGSLLRRLRKRRNLTLRKAAALLTISAPALSRMERGLSGVQRHDVDAAIRGYDLLPWEANQLALAAGCLLPAGPRRLSQEAFDAAVALVGNIALPACAVDEYLYVLAWNDAMQSLWHLDPSGGTPHVLDHMFSPETRAWLGDQWRQLALHTCWQFWIQSSRVAMHTHYHKLLAALEQKHGDDFAAIWRESQERGYQSERDEVQPRESLHASMVGDPQKGYLVLRSALHETLPMSIFVIMPVGAEVEEWLRTCLHAWLTQEQEVHLAPMPSYE